MRRSEHERALFGPLVLGLMEGADTFTLPAGTVTFLLTDIEGSTRMWEVASEAMADAVPAVYRILDDAIARHGGVRPTEQGEGDSVVGAFSRASDALAAALEAQLTLHAYDWPEGAPIRVRIALHAAEAQLRDQRNYFGVALSRCARLRAIAPAGQTVMGRSVNDLVADRLPEGVDLVDLGEHRLRDLGRPENVYVLRHPDLPHDAGPLRSLDSLPNNLPSQLTSFVGRTRELEELRGTLAGTRLLTLTGAGGCGKTRLALQVAADALDRFPAGAWWVELAALEEPDQLEEAVAASVGVRALPGQSAFDSTLAHLRERRALVVLDNCEHVLERAAATAERILRECPGATVLATSRAPLGIAGETDWRVPSLSLPSDERRPREAVEALAQSDAVRLFIERATKVRPNFAITSENAPAVAQVCHDLDGIPLAIELAAARVRMLSVEQLAAALADRFRVLTGGARTAMPRQQTLRASVDWSYELLDEPERVLYRRLGVFAAGWTLDAAEYVCAGDALDSLAILDLLTSLVEKSLVVVEERGPLVRYRFLVTVQQYALERLEDAGEAEALRDRHRDWFAQLASGAAPALETRAGFGWLDLLDADAANLHAAVERAARTDPATGLRLCGDLTLWWKLRGRYAEAEAAYEVALAAGGAPKARARVLWGRAYLLVYTGDYPRAIELAGEAADLAEDADDGGTLARALDVQGTVELFLDPIAARPGLKRARELAATAGDEWCFCDATQILAYTHLIVDEHDEAGRLLDEIEPTLRRTGYPEFVAWQAFGRAAGRFFHGDRAEFERDVRRAIEVADAFGEPTSGGVATGYLACWTAWRGDPEAALAAAAARLDAAVAQGAGIAVPILAIAVATAQLGRGDLVAARAMIEQQLEDPANSPNAIVWLRWLLADVLLAGGDAEAAAEQATAARDLAESPKLRSAALAAPARVALAAAQAARGRWADAERVAHDALDTIDGLRMRPHVPAALLALAEAVAGLESRVEAARLAAAARRAADDLGFVPSPSERARERALLTSLREALDDEEVDRALEEGRALETPDAIGWARRARGERRRPPGGWESLTPTELQVVELTALGLTNPQIGERMFISRGTVKTHLAHVYAKLRVANRTELTALAAQRQPTGP